MLLLLLVVYFYSLRSKRRRRRRSVVWFTKRSIIILETNSRSSLAREEECILWTPGYGLRAVIRTAILSVLNCPTSVLLYGLTTSAERQMSRRRAIATTVGWTLITRYCCLLMGIIIWLV